MAKAATVNKSQIIRDLLEQNPRMEVKEVLEKLSEQNLKVTANLVYYLRTRKRREARQKSAGAPAVSQADPTELIRKIKGLAADVGGVAQLHALVEALQR
jgi:hypothetical protein